VAARIFDKISLSIFAFDGIVLGVESHNWLCSGILLATLVLKHNLRDVIVLSCCNFLDLAE